MKKAYMFLLAALATAACNESILIPEEENPAPEEVTIEAEVTSIGLDRMTVSVEVPGNATYYIARYTDEDFKSVKVDDIVKDLNSRVDAGAAWSSFLKVGSHSFSFNDLVVDTDYKILIFGLRADGTVSTDPLVLDARTENMDFEMSVIENKPFSYSIGITPSRNDVGWFAFTFIGNSEKVADDYLIVLMSYVAGQLQAQGALYEDLVQFGTGTYSAECQPDDKLFCAVVAVDEKFRIISSAATRLPFIPGNEGLLICGDSTTETLHTLIYAYEHKEVGVMMRVLKYDSGNPVFLENIIDFNGLAKQQIGVDINSVTDKEAADALGAYMHYQLVVASNDPRYTPYFEACNTPDEVMALMWYSSDNYYDEGSMWTPFDPAGIAASIGGPIENMNFLVATFKADYNINITTVDHSCSRANFKELGYTFDSASAEPEIKESAHKVALEMMKPALLPTNPRFAHIHVRGARKAVRL